MDQARVDEITKVLEANNIDFYVLYGYVKKAYNSVLVDESRYEAIREALYNEVGGSGWKSEWD